MSSAVANVEASDGNVVIRIPKEKISDFLGDFLKTKRQIGKRFPVVFNIKKEDVINIINVIDHRIKEQNHSIQTDISIDVLHDDGSSRNYPSLDFFRNLDDNLSSVSVAAFIKLSYLVKFPDDETPTKQEINIYAHSRDTGYSWFPISANLEANLLISITTNRFTWAEDIINHFSNYVTGRFEKISRVTIAINWLTQSKLSQSISFLAMTLTAFFFLMRIFSDSIDRMRGKAEEIDHLIGLDTIQSANAKLDFMIRRYSQTDVDLFSLDIAFPYLVYYATFIITAFLLPSIYSTMSDASYVSIGANSVSKNDRKIQKRLFIKYGIIFTAIISVICSISASYLWEKIAPILP